MSGGWKGSSRRATLPPNWGDLVKAVHLRSGGKCERWSASRRKKCGRPADGGVDHKLRGGPDTMENLQDLCGWCHRAKSSAEGNAAKAARTALRTRPAEDHPGRTVGLTDQAAPTRRPREDGT